MKMAGIFAGGLLKKMASLGATKYRDRKERSRAIQALHARLLAHLKNERASSATLRDLRSQASAHGTELQDVAKSLDPSVLPSFFNRELALLSMDGEATPEIQRVLEEYVTALDPPSNVSKSLFQTLARMRQIHCIRTGNIKPITNVTGLVIRNSEIVWYQGDASLVTQDRSSGKILHLGRLFVTNLRMVFTSRTAPDQYQYSDINAVEVEKDQVYITGKSQRTCADFAVAAPEIVAEYIRYAVRAFHRQVDVGFNKNGSRHIPQEIKTAVWQRDVGKCVQCGATDYLEFDHIIPVAKGGANTTQNVQLLCRRCNGNKSDKI